ncbi:DUF421 domain-containing protein [Pseudalkalibacillus caeni]|uniref:DUF421 domain-containing protein n=1 Tax=Exobacillus caeni TaxID=2574798 RepID=A0A5R9F297_9BACL|nr:DUF421 domain-containing protein [Pseudalkalibacillus caeni]TLS37782.1 DUF421 domain-containing protein [Pseudalkalibacillus caeni]
MTILNTTVELVFGFFSLLILTKLLGKRQISQITPFDFISSLILGELVGNAIYDKDVKIWSIFYAVILWVVLIFIIELLTQKFRKTRTVLEGNPSIVIRNGEIDRQQLKRNKLDTDELQNLLRQKNVFSLREVEFAILETNGSISVLKKPEYGTPTNKDLNIPIKPVYLPVAFISDGCVDEGNLKKAGLTREWLDQQLKSQSISDPKEVMYAEWKQDEGLFISKKKKD